MTPVRMELGVHLLEAPVVDDPETGAAFTVACIFRGCIRLSCIDWQETADGWRSAHCSLIDIQERPVTIESHLST